LTIKASLNAPPAKVSWKAPGEKGKLILPVSPVI